MDYQQIVWLASYPKSGNTWVRCFLDAYFLGELDINDIVCSIPDDSAYTHLVGDGSDVREFPIDIQALTRPMALLRVVRQYEAGKLPGVPLFVKTHAAHLLANGIEMLPLALTKAVVYIVRDPRDVILSFAKHTGQSVDEAIDKFFNKYSVLQAKEDMKVGDFVSSWPKHVASYVNADSHNVLVIRYEDMKADPVVEFTKILEHAGVEVDQDRVQRAVDTVTLENLRAQEAKNGFKESSKHAKDQFFGEGKTGGWVGKLTPAQLHRIEKGCQSMLKRFYPERAVA